MKINHEYSRVLRAGYKIDKDMFRKQSESAGILIFTITVCLAILLILHKTS